MACEYGPIAAGAPSVATTVRSPRSVTGSSLLANTHPPYHPDALYSALGMSRNLRSHAGDPMNVTT